jgi:hypothetical protein
MKGASSQTHRVSTLPSGHVNDRRLARRPVSLWLKALVLPGLLVAMLIRASPVHAATYTVNRLAWLDDGACTGTHCTLIEAINAANANAGPDTITFNIPNGTFGAPPYLINGDCADAQLTLSDAGTTIDATTEPGYAGSPLIELRGVGIEICPALRVLGADTTIRGLSITDWSAGGIYVEGTAAANTLIQDNYIGLQPNGTTVMGNMSIGGIGIFGGATSTQIVNNAMAGNIVAIHAAETCAGFCSTPAAPPAGIHVENNRIGTNASGTLALSGSSILIESASDITILNNVISGSPAVPGYEGLRLNGVTNAII